jgi:hypothetical protein
MNDEPNPVKKVLVSALIIAVIVALMIAVMLVGEAFNRWLG